MMCVSRVDAGLQLPVLSVMDTVRAAHGIALHATQSAIGCLRIEEKVLTHPGLFE